MYRIVSAHLKSLSSAIQLLIVLAAARLRPAERKVPATVCILTIPPPSRFTQ